jgi:uncharacterized membrane protein YdjX (TVP38/TMEM64 family)
MKLPRKEWVWILVTAGVLLATAFSSFEVIAHPQGMREWISGYGAAGPVIFVGVFTVLTAAGAPRMLMYPISGLLFGFLPGLFWSMLATLGGAYLAFSYARWAGSAWVRSKWPQTAHMARQLDGRSAFKVAVIRQLPLPGALSNLLFGIMQVSHQDFLIGSMIGFLPTAIPANLIGSSISMDSQGLRVTAILIGAAIILVLWGASPYLLRKPSGSDLPCA